MFWIYPPVKYSGSRKKGKCSMPHIDKNRYILPSVVWTTRQQKRHSVQSALTNGGAENFDGVRVLRTLGGDAHFPV